MVTTTGYYGKIPSKGDFVSRNLPRSFIEPWDRWLQAALECSRSHLGDEWLDVYLTSPLWRFALSSGICGDHVWAGVLMPSVDRVGRYFPFTLATRLAEASDPVRTIGELDVWYAQAEAMVLSTLDDGFDLDEFATQLERFQPPEVVPPPSSLHAGRQHEPLQGWRVELQELTRIAEHYPELASKALREIFFAFGLWATTGSEQAPPTLLVYQGLPPIESYASMLAAQWYEAADADQSGDCGKPAASGLTDGDTQPPRKRYS